MVFIRAAARWCGLGALAVVACAAGGCTVSRLMATADPGNAPRAAQPPEVLGVGGDQVRFTFRFKAGADVARPADPAPVPTGMAARIEEASFNDTRGSPLSVAEQEVRNQANEYTVVLTSGPVGSGSFEVVCQGQVVVGGYLVKLCGSAYRDPAAWRANPRSFAFGVYRVGQTTPIWERW